MSLLRCNSCLTTWPKPRDGQPVLPHVCPAEVIDQHAKCDPATGNVLTPASFKRVENPRNENYKPHPDKPREYVMISEGSGVTEIE